MKLFKVTNTTWENLQIAKHNQYNVRSEWHWFVRCDLQIFSGCVCHLEQLHAQSPFLFPIVFSINFFVPGLCYLKLRIVSAVETIGARRPIINGSKTSNGDMMTTTASFFSQTVMDIDVFENQTSPDNNGTLQQPGNDVEYQSSFSDDSSDPRVNLSRHAFSSMACPHNGSQSCSHRLQINTYTKGTLFHESEPGKKKTTTLNSWVIGVKVNELQSINWTSPLLRIQIQPLNSTKVNL